MDRITNMMVQVFLKGRQLSRGGWRARHWLDVSRRRVLGVGLFDRAEYERSGLCCACLQLQRAQLHTSSPLGAGKIKNTKKKLIKPINLGRKKSLKASREVVTIAKEMSIQELAESLGKDVDHVFEALMFVENSSDYDEPHSVIANFEVIKAVVDKCGYRWKLGQKKRTEDKENKDVFRRPAADPASLVKRPPVVTIMGHVDHGKTTLLDSLRKTNVVAQEFGGITQHIGAFSVRLPSGEQITFLDTPGHAAFSAMRARGAGVTDIVVLVVAAEDGVMNQTLESIKHAQDANVPVIVAINKIDRPEADIEMTKQMLLESGVQLEDFGGDVQAVPISALKGTNLTQLEEAIVALAEQQELKAEPSGLVEGVVVESRTDPGRGKLSTAIIQRGTLRKGMCLVAGTAWAKVRGMFNDSGRPVLEAPPSTPVEVIGWRDLPSAGEDILQVESEVRAREVIAWREAEVRDRKVSDDHVIIQQKLDDHQRAYQVIRQQLLESGKRRRAIYRRDRTKEIIQTHTGPELAIVLKGDVDGSVEALLDTLDTYQSDQCRLHLLHYGVGVISEQDVEMAAAFNGVIYGFNVQCADKAAKLAREKGVELQRHNVIYRLLEDIKQQLTDRLQPSEVDEVLGEANVLQSFIVTEGKKKIPIAGCRCVKGTLQKKKHFKLVRDGEVFLRGQLSSLKHFKNEVESIKMDVECGLSFDDKTVVPQPGDRVVCYETKEVKPTLDWGLDF